MIRKVREEIEQHTSHNEQEILASEVCGCLACSATLGPHEVTQWTDDDERHPRGTRPDRTAICPHCGEAMIIGDNSGYKISPAFFDTAWIH